MEREDDVNLIRKILSGDDAAFSILVEKYQKSIHALAWRKIHDFHYAEEIVQDTFLRAYKNLPTLKNHNQFAGWLHVIANRLCIDWIRRQKPVMQSLEDTCLEEIEKTSYTHHMSEQRLAERTEHHQVLVKNLLAKLPKNERKIVTLYYLDEMSTIEISKFMGVSVNTITSQLQRARKRLQTDQEFLVQEFSGHLQLSDNQKENIMGQLEGIRNKFNSFMEQMNSDPISGVDALKEAYNQVEDALKSEITSELVHLADEIYEYMGKLGLKKSVSLHRKYLNVVLDNKERFWSHRRLGDGLISLQKNREAIEEQIRLYCWACKHLSDEYVLDIVSCISHVNCWTEQGRIDEWFQLYDEASKRLENPEVSRYKRCWFLEVGAVILQINDRLDETLLKMEQLERANNDPSWENYFRFWLAVIKTRIEVHGKRENWDQFEQALTEVSAFIEKEMEKRDTGYSINLNNLTKAARDVGCCLSQLKKYNEARRFLQIDVDLSDHVPANSYFVLAVSIWASEKDREKTLHHLKCIQNYEICPKNIYYLTFLETPEFSDVKDDPEFLKVLGQK